MIENSELPKGWVRVGLKELVDKVSDGPFGSNLKTADYVKKGVRVIRLENIGYMEFRNEFQSFVTESKYETIKKHTVAKGDIILSSFVSENIRAVILPDSIDKAINKADCFLIRPCVSKICNKYLFYYFSTREMYQQLINKIHGATRPRINTTQLKLCQIPLAYLPEQHRIVAKIEELFSSLDKGIESLKTAQQQLKVYRQAVLKWAFEGKLTNKNTVGGELPKSWKWTKISDVIKTLDQGWSPKCENKSSHHNNEWAVIKTTAIQLGYFLETENKLLPINLEPRKQHELQPGDILITRAGPRVRVGVCCMIKHVRPKLINSDKVYRIRVKANEIIPNFLAMALNSPDYSDEIERMKTGISDSGLNLTQKGFVQILIKLPPIKEQQLIVSEIESRLSVCDKIEESIVQSLKQAESLRQSILKKAFEGKLVPQDPNDEPAGVLLERIRRERAEIPAAKTKKTRCKGNK